MCTVVDPESYASSSLLLVRPSKLDRSKSRCHTKRNNLVFQVESFYIGPAAQLIGRKPTAMKLKEKEKLADFKEKSLA